MWPYSDGSLKKSSIFDGVRPLPRRPIIPAGSKTGTVANTTYDRRIALNDVAIHIGAIVMSNPSIAEKLPVHYHKFLLLFDPKEAEKLPDNKGCDHRIELLGAEDKL